MPATSVCPLCEEEILQFDMIMHLIRCLNERINNTYPGYEVVLQPCPPKKGPKYLQTNPAPHPFGPLTSPIAKPKAASQPQSSPRFPIPIPVPNPLSVKNADLSLKQLNGMHCFVCPSLDKKNVTSSKKTIPLLRIGKYLGVSFCNRGHWYNQNDFPRIAPSIASAVADAEMLPTRSVPPIADQCSRHLDEWKQQFPDNDKLECCEGFLSTAPQKDKKGKYIACRGPVNKEIPIWVCHPETGVKVFCGGSCAIHYFMVKFPGTKKKGV